MDTAPVSTVSASYLDAPYTAVVIWVREAETLVRRRALQSEPALLPRDRSPVARITLLAPFLPLTEIDQGVIAELTRRCADVTAFDYELTEVCRFPQGATYLSPEPVQPFRRLTLELHRAFPEIPAHDSTLEIVPHLRVPLAPGEDTEDLRRTLHGILPLAAHAVDAALIHVAEENTYVIATLPFGTTAA